MLFWNIFHIVYVNIIFIFMLFLLKYESKVLYKINKIVEFLRDIIF